MGGGDLLPPDDAPPWSSVIGGVLAEDGRLGVAVAARPCLPHAVKEGADGRFVVGRELAAGLHGRPCFPCLISHRVSRPTTSGSCAGGGTGCSAAASPVRSASAAHRSPCAVVGPHRRRPSAPGVGWNPVVPATCKDRQTGRWQRTVCTNARTGLSLNLAPGLDQRGCVTSDHDRVIGQTRTNRDLAEALPRSPPRRSTRCARSRRPPNVGTQLRDHPRGLDKDGLVHTTTEDFQPIDQHQGRQQRDGHREGDHAELGGQVERRCRQERRHQAHTMTINPP
jgi:hypothetical protein